MFKIMENFITYLEGNFDDKNAPKITITTVCFVVFSSPVKFFFIILHVIYWLYHFMILGFWAYIRKPYKICKRAHYKTAFS